MRFLAALLVVTLPFAVAAQESPTPMPVESTVHRHLGFFFRADIGVGYVHSSSAASDGPQPPVSSLSIPIGFAVGGAVAEDWILAGEIWGVAGPQDVDPPGKGLLVYGYALAVVHYFMPANVYLSVAPGITRLMFVTGNTSVSSDWGPGVKLALGKEWWVGDHWGLGVAAECLVTFNKDGGASRTTVAPGLTFSATFN
jgi:hypothetical protein